jgi:phosphoenolpyruvate carboxylase
LRAIPFVGSWSQLKQNVPGFSVGTALKHFEDTEQWDKVQDLYDNSIFQNIENSMMSITKSFFR